MQRNRIPIIGLIIFGVLALGMTAMSLLGGNKTQTVNPAPVQNVSATPEPTPSGEYVVANTFIPPRTVITSSMLALAKKPGAPGAFTSFDQVTNRMASGPINSGSAINASDVTLPIQRKIPADFEIPQGLRAVAIYVDPAQTAAGLVDKGDRVDVIASYKMTFDKQDTEYYTQLYTGSKTYTMGRTVAQDLLVIGVDQSLLAPPATPVPTPGEATVGGAAAPPATPSPTPGAGPARIRVLLAATPAVAERLVAANDAGTLHLTVRGPTSREIQPLAGAREYPINVYNVRKKQPLKEASEGLKNFASGMRDLRDVAQNNPPMANPSNIPPATTVTTMSPTTSPVTVIRGTNKTNVNVPVSP